MVSYRQLQTRQPPPWVGLALGAGGMIHALLPGSGAPQRIPSDAVRAEALRLEAGRSRHRQGGLWGGDFAERDLTSSVFYGEGGLDYLAVRSSPAPGEVPARLKAFVSRARRATTGPSELLFGTAGYLSALCVVLRSKEDSRVRAACDSLAGTLLERLGGDSGWARALRRSFAHGRAGISHALLSWSLATRNPLPSSFLDQLAALAREEPESKARSKPDVARSWCSGSAGLGLLMARAYEVTGERAWLRGARKAARTLTSHTSRVSGDLCCGLGGRAYTLLALDRVDPGAGWFEAAVAMAGEAVDRTLGGWGTPWPNGLLKGFPGLVCLTRDLLATPGNRAGFPLVES